MSRVPIGEIAALSAAIIWAFTVCVYRAFGSHVSSYIINLYKNIVALTCVGVTLWIFQSPLSINMTDAFFLVLSGIIGIVVGDTTGYGALKRLGAPLSSTALCIAPPVSTLFAVVIYNEVLTGQQFVGMCLAILGVLGVVLVNHKNIVNPIFEYRKGILLMVACGVSHGVGAVLARGPMQRVDVFYGTFLRLAPAVLVLCGQLLLDKKEGPFRMVFLEKKGAAAMAIAAFFGTYLGLVLFAVSLRYTKAGVVSSIVATYPIWVVPVARYFLKEKSPPQAYLFTVLAVLGIVLLVEGT